MRKWINADFQQDRTIRSKHFWYTPGKAKQAGHAAGVQAEERGVAGAGILLPRLRKRSRGNGRSRDQAPVARSVVLISKSRAERNGEKLDKWRACKCGEIYTEGAPR
jgi:hypothetical protein